MVWCRTSCIGDRPVEELITNVRLDLYKDAIAVVFATRASGVKCASIASSPARPRRWANLPRCCPMAGENCISVTRLGPAATAFSGG
jgi:hypothetical protein